MRNNDKMAILNLRSFYIKTIYQKYSLYVKLYFDINKAYASNNYSIITKNDDT